MPITLRKPVLFLCTLVPVLCCSCGWMDNDRASALRDGRIAVNLHTAIHADPRLAGADVSFYVQSGDVLIQAATLTDNQRALAVAIARDTVGVKHVVAPEGDAAGQLAAGRANFGLLRNLSSVIALKQQLRMRGLGSQVQLDVGGEHVTVYGEVSSKAERRWIVATLMADPEVSHVVDKTRLASETSRNLDWRSAFDDSVTTSKVKLAMKLNRRLAGQSIKVKTRRSEVVLTGSVDSAELAELAAQIAADVAGVSKVTNKLTVDAPSAGRPRRTRGD